MKSIISFLIRLKQSRSFLFTHFFAGVFLIFLLFSSCNSTKNIKLGFIYSDETHRFILESEYFAQRAEELGAEVLIMSGGGNEIIQYERALEMIHSGVDVLVIISVNANISAAIVREAKSSGVKVMAYNRLIPNSDLDMFIAGDNNALGAAMVDYATSRVPRGNYILMGGDKFDRNGIELQAAIETLLEPKVKSGDINIIYKTFTENWSGEYAAFDLDQFLNNSTEVPDVIISAYDGLSQKMIEVLKEHDLAGKVILTGQDAELASLRHIVQGNQHLTMFHPYQQTAYKAAEVAVKMARNERLDDSEMSTTDNGFKEVPTVKVISVPIMKENLDEVIVRGGIFTYDEVYN